MTVLSTRPEPLAPPPPPRRLGDVVAAWPAAVVAPVLLAVALTAWRYDAKSLWRDEVYTLTTAGRPFADMLGLLATRDAGLLGYYALMNPWLAVSDSSAWLRLPSALAAPVAVGLCAALGRRVGGNAVGLVAGVLVALAPGVVRFAQEARPYSLVLAATSLTALLLLQSAEAPRRWRWAVLAVVAALAVALHPLVALPAVAGLFAAVWLRPGRAKRRWFAAAGAPAAAIGLALVAVGVRQAVASPPAPASPDEYLTFWRLMSTGAPVGFTLLALAAVGAVVLRHRRREVMVLVAWAVAPIAAVTLLGLTGGYFNARYATASVPALCLLVAACATSVRALAPRGERVVVAAVLLAVLALQGPSAVAQRALPYYFDDAPGAAQALAVAARPGDAVVFVGPVARPLVAPHLPPVLQRSGYLEDPLLVASPDASGTLGGREVPSRQRAAVLAPYDRVWLVGTKATATDDLARPTASTEAAAEGRRLVTRHDHGAVRVELWAVPEAQ